MNKSCTDYIIINERVLTESVCFKITNTASHSQWVNSAMPASSWSFSNCLIISPLVSISATMSSEARYVSLILPASTRSWMKWYFMSICLVLPWTCWLLARHMADWLTSRIVSQMLLFNKSLVNSWSHIRRFLGSSRQCNILCFCGWQGHASLFAALPANSSTSQKKYIPRSWLPVSNISGPVGIWVPDDFSWGVLSIYKADQGCLYPSGIAKSSSQLSSILSWDWHRNEQHNSRHRRYIWSGLCRKI